MTRYSYTAIPIASAASRLVTGRLEAADERAARADLRSRGLVPVEVRPLSPIDALRAMGRRDRLSGADRAWFFQNLSMLLTSKLAVEQAMTTMIEIAPSPRTKAASEQVRDALRKGSSLAEAVEAQAGLASPQHIALLASGGESGRLDHAVGLVDRSIATAQRIRRTVVGKMIYPSILLFAAVGVVWFLATRVIPQFAEQLAMAGSQLPLATRATLGAGSVLAWALPLFVGVVVLLIALRRYWITPRVRTALSRLALRAPLARTLVWNTQAAVITDVMGTMLEGGGDALAALKQAREVVSSPVIASRMSAAERAVREGADLGEAFSRNDVLPPVSMALVRVGMRTGDLPQALRRATDAALGAQERLTERLLTFLEPAVIVFMAGGVGWVVYALIAGMMALQRSAMG